METAKWVLSVATFHVLNNPDIAVRLKAELLEAWPDTDVAPTLAELEKLPYFVAVVQEGQSSIQLYQIMTRLLIKLYSPPPFLRSSRSSSPYLYLTSALQLMGHTRWNSLLPVCLPSTPQRDHLPLLSHLPPLALALQPETGAPATAPSGKLLTRYLGSFSRGTRGCIGVHLAYAEIYLALASVFRKCELELWETTERDVEVWAERFMTQVYPDSKGIRVLVK